MKGHIPLKHGLKRVAGGLASLSSRIWTLSAAPQVTVLLYHRVSDTGCFDWSVDDWNVAPGRFERQIAWLSKNAECIPLTSILPRLEQGSGEKPVVAITFDDGFGNFTTRALPVLDRYQVPATVFLVTRYVGTDTPYPFDHWAQRNVGRTDRESWVPITWEQVERCATGGLVTFGSHSHTHPQPAGLSAAQLTQEAVQSRGMLRSRLGDEHAQAYAFPYGSTRLGHVTPAYVDAVRDAGFALAFATDLGTVRPGVDPFRLPRIEAHSWDSPSVVAAKARGVLWPFRLTDALRRAKRA